MSSQVPLRDGWTLWPWIWVRAAGFPAARLLELAALPAAAAADHVIAVQQRLADSRAAVLEELAVVQQSRGPLASPASSLVKRVRRGDTITDEPELAAHAPALVQLPALQQELVTARASLDTALAAAANDTWTVLQQVGRDPRFREALLWQNPQALKRGVDWLLAHEAVANKRARQNQHLVASYLQRYCAKNDTIGFFGPIAWGRVVDAPTVTVAPGNALLRTRKVHFEHWAIDAIADSLAAAPDIRPHVAPRLLPTVTVTGTTLRYGLGKTTTVPPTIARVLAACDGIRPAFAIAQSLCADGEIEDASELYELLDNLVDKRLVVWTLEPSAVFDPDVALRSLVAGIADDAARTRAVAVIDAVDASRREVAEAAGDPGRLERALEALNAKFTELSGSAATRRGGQTYAGRTIVFEDCVRDLEIEIGRPVLDTFAPLFTLVAQSARWFTYQLATRFRAALRERFVAVVDASGELPYVRFLSEIQDLLPRAGDTHASSPIADQVVDELERTWATLLALDPHARTIERSASELRDRVASAFAAPAPGWPGARHIAPDIMFAARDVDALRRGDCIAVLGEVHIGNTFFPRFLQAHQPIGDDSLIAAYDTDRAHAGVVPVPPRDQVNRAQTQPWSRVDLDLELGDARSWKARELVMRAGDLVVEAAGDSLAVRDTRTGRRLDIIAVLESYLTIMTGRFRTVPAGAHVPRVTVDGTVLCREQWRFSGEAVPRFEVESAAEQFVAVRAWAAQLGMPRFVFAKVPDEPKPTYLDLASPTYVAMFARSVKSAASLTVSEMLPSIEDCWLPDADGSRYTAELRMIAVDPVAWSPQVR